MTTTALLDIGILKKKIEGYPDPTCYRVLKAIQRAEIDWAHQMDIPIRFFDADFQEVHLILVGALGQRYSHEARVAYASAPPRSRSMHTLNSCGDNSEWGETVEYVAQC